MASNKRFILIGKIVVAVVKAPDVILTRIFKEITQASKIRKSLKTKRKVLKRSKSSQKRPSPAQLKARKLFAMRAKRGDFK